MSGGKVAVDQLGQLGRADLVKQLGAIYEKSPWVVR